MSTKPDRRQDKRHRAPATGTITSEDGSRVYSCTTDNVSESGALLQIATDALMPSIFKLNVPGEKLDRVCKIIWRIDRKIGVEFI
jgi:hypothetical protein